MIDIVSEIVLYIKTYIKDWEIIHKRKDQIAFTKEHYKKLAQKANFNWSWESNNSKQPASQIIQLSSLKRQYARIERQEFVIRFWKKNLSDIRRVLRDFENTLEQYKKAINISDKAHQKPQLVSFRKSFLYLISLINETLIPINNGSLCFPNLEKLGGEERDEKVQNFVNGDGKNYRYQLAEKIKEIKEFFEQNGGYVPFGRVTLNPYTAQQKPHKFNDEIEEIIASLKLTELYDFLIKKSDKEILEYFELRSENKKYFFLDKHNDLIIRVQAFKYKPIPVSVRYMLADYIAKNKKKDKHELTRLFEQIGMQRSPAKDYADLGNKEEFDLNNYPLKIAFDYAWESIANYINNPSAINFPKDECEIYLKNNFSVNSDEIYLKIYADLLFIKQNLATLEHEENSPKNWQDIIMKTQEKLDSMDLAKNYSGQKTKIKESIKAIKDWLNNYENWKHLTEREKKQKEKEDLHRKFLRAKQFFGLKRGEQKNRIKKYKELTEQFKKTASDFGRKFANLRDKLYEESALNKIDYFGVIIEDNNQDRYLLIKKLDENNEVPIDILLRDDSDGILKTFYIKSLTSKTVNKLISNKGKYPTFHDKGSINPKDKEKSLEHIKTSLTSSSMAIKQNWNEFHWSFNVCDSFAKLEKEIDSKGHILKEQKLSYESIKSLVELGNCLLLPFVNQDITSDKRELKNQFSKDWNLMFEKDNDYRLHPELKIVFRHPTPDYPKPEEKRYSRFQMIAQVLCEYIPKKGEYLSKKEQLTFFNNQKEQEKYVDKFNKKVNTTILKDEYYIFGIDRGIAQLATLCIINQDGVIENNFPIYTRKFNGTTKEWEHELLEYRNILDLSNLRVETTVKGEKVLVDLSCIKLKNGEENKQKIKLKKLAYIRKLQYQMQEHEEQVLLFFENYKTKEEIADNIKNLITHYKEGSHYSDLPIDDIYMMLTEFKNFCNANDFQAKKELIELDAAENLKAGVVANMIGVVSFLVNDFSNGKYRGKSYISLENLCRAYGFSVDGLTGATLESTQVNRHINFKKQENLTLAGLGTYHFLEMQLLKKLFKVQQESEVNHLVPHFRSTNNYEMIRKITKVKDKVEYVSKPFGIVHFVDPANTSRKCPNCGKGGQKNIKRKDNVITCKVCNYTTKQPGVNLTKKGKNIELIIDGDQNGAYHIALKTFENLQKLKNNKLPKKRVNKRRK